MGKLAKGLFKFTVAATAVSGLCYLFKDQIKESQVYKDYDVDTKINKVKSTIKEKVPAIFDNEKDFVEDDEIFIEDDSFDPANTSRDYVSITPAATEENASADSSEASDVAEASESFDTSDKETPDEITEVPTVDLGE